MKFQSQKLLYNFYLLLFPLSYYLLFVNFRLVIIPNVLILVLSYYYLVLKKKNEPVLFLMLFARCLNGPTFPNNDIAFNILNLLTAYIPFFIFLIQRSKFAPKVYLSKYKFTVVYAIILLLYCLVDIGSAKYVLFTRIIPFLLFVLCLYKLEVDIHAIYKFLKYLVIVSLLVFFFTSYIDKLRPLIENAIIFKLSAAVGNITYYILPRNSGVFFDPRVLGFFGVLFIYMTLILKKAGFFNVFVGIACVATTLSRGSMVSAAIILAGYALLMLLRQPLLKKLKIIAIVVITMFSLSAVILSNSELREFLEVSFSLNEEGNALDQRSELLTYSINTFLENPWGVGTGVLKNPTIDRGFGLDEYQNNVTISDAFIATIAAETGVFGILFLLLSLAEILITRKHTLSYFLFLGFIIQLVGTDIPDFGMLYFVFLMCVLKTNQALVVQLRNNFQYLQQLKPALQ